MGIGDSVGTVCKSLFFLKKINHPVVFEKNAAQYFFEKTPGMGRHFCGGTKAEVWIALPGPGIFLTKSFIKFAAPHRQKCYRLGGRKQVFFLDPEVFCVDEIIDAEILVRIQQKDLFKNNQ